jgi:uncharacterized membrane protein
MELARTPPMRIPLLSGLTARVIDQWIRVRSSYWFLPSLMTVAAVGAALGLVTVDRTAPEWVSSMNLIVSSQPEGAREVLGTVAGSMITVAGVTFSMTLLMVSFASAQLGPRLVPRFLRDRGNQVVLGMFIATFIYCLIVLRTVRSAAADGTALPGAAQSFVPHLATLGAVVLALLSVAVLIYFLHHVPMRINASSVIGLLGDELVLRLERDFPAADDEPLPLEWSPDSVSAARTIRLEDTGCYLRIVDYAGLVAFARRHELRCTTLVAPGAFCVPGTAIAHVHGRRIDDACAREVHRFFSWGGDRTPDQDILFLVEQLAEIAGKALSTGVNDQFTALLCIDQMERALCGAARRRDPDRLRGCDGVAYVAVEYVSLREVAERFAVPLRQFTRGDLIATDRLLAMFENCVRRAAEASALRHCLQSHSDAAFTDAMAALASPSEREWLAARHRDRRASAVGA